MGLVGKVSTKPGMGAPAVPATVCDDGALGAGAAPVRTGPMFCRLTPDTFTEATPRMLAPTLSALGPEAGQNSLGEDVLLVMGALVSSL